MNPFSTASAFGYSTEEILKFAASAMPGFEDKIKMALAAGYTADEVMKFLGNAYQGKIPRSHVRGSSGGDVSDATKRMGPMEAGPIRRARANARQRNIGDLLDPGRLATQAAGAGIGYAMGGPVGAVAGLYGGTVANDDIMRKYAEYIETGGQLNLEDYLKSALKGGIKGISAYAAAKMIPDILAAIQGTKGGEPGTDLDPNAPPPGEGPIIDIGEPTAPDQPGQPPAPVPVAPTVPSVDPEQARGILNQAGVLGQLTNLAKNNTPEELAGLARSILHGGKAGALEKKTGMSIEDLVTAAFPVAEQEAQGQEVAPQEEQGFQGAQTGSGTPIAPESESGISNLGNMGGGIVNSYYDAILDSIKKTGDVPPQEKGTNVGRAWEANKDKLTPEQFVLGLQQNQGELSKLTPETGAGTPLAPEETGSPLVQLPQVGPEIGAGTPLAPEGPGPTKFPGYTIEGEESKGPPDLEKKPPKRTIDEISRKAIDNTLKQGMPTPNPKGIDKSKLIDMSALKSSNVRALYYDPKSEYAQVMFSSGQAYEFPDVPVDVINKVLKGSDTPLVTEGDNAFRTYSSGKTDVRYSIGKAFSEHMKPNYKGVKVEDEKIRDRGMRAVQKSDRIHEASETFDGFHKIREKARASDQIMESKELQAVTDGMSDENRMALILETRQAMKKYSKERENLPKPKSGRPTTAGNVAVEIAKKRGLPPLMTESKLSKTTGKMTKPQKRKAVLP